MRYCRFILFLNIFLYSVPSINIHGQSIGETNFISQYGITWYFSEEHEYGRFANGDYWVVGPVQIDSITPHYINEDAFYHNQWVNRWINGWEVNPPAGTGVGHGFGSEIPGFDPDVVPDLPYLAGPGESILKSVRSDVPPRADQVNRCERCLQTMGVLTVVAEPPPGNGTQVFRPPYVGDDKPYYFVDSLRTHLLPSVKPAGNPPTLEQVARTYKMVQIEHKGQQMGYDTRPLDNFNNQVYGGAVGRTYGQSALVLMLDHPLEDKMEALIYFTQMSIDFYHCTVEGRNFGPGGGHQPGHMLPLAWFAVMLGDDDIKDYVKNEAVFKTSEHDFLHPSIYDSTKALYGSRKMVFMSFDSFRYWNYLTYDRRPENMHAICYPDPHGFIDGGGSLERNYSGYQNIMNGPWLGLATAGRIMPELADIYNNPLLFDYVERWYSHGLWTQPDPCAPSTGDMDDYGVLFGANPDYDPGDPTSPPCILDPNIEYYNSPADFQCKDGEQCGRWPERHGMAVGAENPSYASPFITAMWEEYYDLSVNVDDRSRAEEIVSGYRLEQNYPNPFNPSTTIGYTVAEGGHVTLIVYDILGREVAILINEERAAGTYEVVWDGKNRNGNRGGSGIYLYRITDGRGSVRSKKMIMLK